MTTNDAPFRFSAEGKISILELLPELNKVQWGEIEAIGTEVLGSLESQSQPLLIVDLTPLSYMGSAMVALIVRVWKMTKTKNGQICVICPHASVFEVLKLAALDKVWNIVDDMDEARAMVGAGRSSGSSGGSSAGVVVIGLILLIACGALVAFAVKPSLLGLENGKQAPAGQPEQSGNDSEPAPAPTEPAPESEETTPETPVPEPKPTKPKEDSDKKPTSESSTPEKVEAKPESKPETEPESKPTSPEKIPEEKPEPESKPDPKPATEEKPE
ncbi:MAG: STAS domain-containing protein [Planctomycetaceae bacterium]|nr:STAS domain-containing protein [Planctomycetaceae bacterium]